MAAIAATQDTDSVRVPRYAPSETMSALEAAGAQRNRWASKYARALVVSDTVLVVVVLGAVSYAGSQPWMLPILRGRGEVPVVLVVAVLAAVLLTALSLTGSRAARVVGTGSQEYRAIVQSAFATFASVALLAYVMSVAGMHFILVAGLITSIPALTLSRWLWRRWLVARRREGRMSNRVLLVGSEASIASTAANLRRAPAAGLHVVGACTPSGTTASYIPGTEIPISGSVSRVMEAMHRTDADTLLITSASELSPDRVRALSWQLEPGRQHLIVAPSLTDIGGPRLHTRPVAGLPLVHVETPRFTGGKIYLKRTFDTVSAALLIVLLSPVMLAAAIAVKISSGGDVFFSQERIGLGGERFRMLKFRSMYADAEQRLAELDLAARDRGNDVMFKMKDDPRVTPAGRILRRYSLDELPQLFNVLSGSMALVGPRPPLGREVERYAQSVHRRFLVRPGITGLWQVSGRSDLNWDETVRLDLFYVENWTLTGDLIILLKTARAVLHSHGAY